MNLILASRLCNQELHSQWLVQEAQGSNPGLSNQAHAFGLHWNDCGENQPQLRSWGGHHMLSAVIQAPQVAATEGKQLESGKKGDTKWARGSSPTQLILIFWPSEFCILLKQFELGSFHSDPRVQANNKGTLGWTSHLFKKKLEVKQRPKGHH